MSRTVAPEGEIYIHVIYLYIASCIYRVHNIYMHIQICVCFVCVCVYASHHHACKGRAVLRHTDKQRESPPRTQMSARKYMQRTYLA
jgi:hypothetical protein